MSRSGIHKSLWCRSSCRSLTWRSKSQSCFCERHCCSLLLEFNEVGHWRISTFVPSKRSRFLIGTKSSSSLRLNPCWGPRGPFSLREGLR